MVYQITNIKLDVLIKLKQCKYIYEVMQKILNQTPKLHIYNVHDYNIWNRNILHIQNE